MSSGKSDKLSDKMAEWAVKVIRLDPKAAEKRAQDLEGIFRGWLIENGINHREGILLAGYVVTVAARRETPEEFKTSWEFIQACKDEGLHHPEEQPKSQEEADRIEASMKLKQTTIGGDGSDDDSN